MTTIDLATSTSERLFTSADRRLVQLETHLSIDALELADRILVEPDPVVGTEMLGQLKELVATIKLIRAILDVEL